MKIAIVNYFSNGGAAKAAIRLNNALNLYGVDSNMLIISGELPQHSFKFSEYSVTERLSRFYTRFYKQNKYDKVKLQIPVVNSFPECVFDITRHPLIQEADIINLHWVGEMINYKSFFKKIKKPIVWTLHDMNPFLGFAHYKYDLSLIPQYKALDDKVALLKQKAIAQNSNLSIVTLCPWMREHSEQSIAFADRTHYTLPNSLDTTIYHYYDKSEARESLGLPGDRRIVMFCSDYIYDSRKGFDLLLEATQNLSPEILFLVVGNVNTEISLPNNFLFLGAINDEQKLAEIYACADLFVIPSREDNLPNTMLEALCCGTPVVSFANGGMRDNIVDMENGIIAYECTSDSLVAAINHCLSHLDHFNSQKIAADSQIKFSPVVQASAYIDLFTKLL